MYSGHALKQPPLQSAWCSEHLLLTRPLGSVYPSHGLPEVHCVLTRSQLWAGDVAQR